VALAVSCGGLLGQGERCHVDPRFGTPSATLTTYWEALWSDDEMVAAACFAEPDDAVPVPGSLWFLPPSRALILSDVRLLPVDTGRLVVSYEVRFRPVGSLDEHGFEMASELLRTSGGWRIVRATVGTDLPEWRPIPHRVDI